MTKEEKISEKVVSKSIKSGIVTSDKMDKTIVVKVNSLKKHPRYQKRYTSSKKYKVHDENNEHGIGDKVVIEAHKPISKDKCWTVVS